MIKTDFNPYLYAKFREYRFSGDTQEMPLMKNGKPVTQKDSKGMERQVMGPMIFIPRVYLTEWFWSAFPEGSILDDMVSASPDETIVKVTLAADRNNGSLLTSSYGVAKKNTAALQYGGSENMEPESDMYRLAYYIALQSAMEKAGFLLDYDPDAMIKYVPGFKEACHAGELITDIDSDGIESEQVAELVSEPPKAQIESEARMETAQSTLSAAEEAIDPIAEFNADGFKSKKVRRSEDEIETMLKESSVELSNPISEFSNDTAQEREENKTNEKTSEKCQQTKDTEAGEIIFTVSENAGMKLRSYAGEKIKNLPEDFVKNVAARENWRGLIAQESLDAIKEYASI